MKLFLKKITIFTIIPLIFGLLILFFPLKYFLHSTLPIQISSNISNVFVGDSHIQYALNDSIIPQSVNIAESAEPYYFSYHKLKFILTKYHSIRHIYLGVSYHNLSNVYDRHINGDLSIVTMPKYYYLLPSLEKIKMIYWNKAHFISLLKSIVRQSLIPASFGRNNFMGKFINYHSESSAILSSMDERILYIYYNNGSLNFYSRLNIEYLSEIITLCKQRDVQLTIINTPLHEYYYNKVPEVYKAMLNKIITSNNLDYVDFTLLKLEDRCFIPDGDHVSSLGAEITSIKLKEIINRRNK